MVECEGNYLKPMYGFSLQMTMPRAGIEADSGFGETTWRSCFATWGLLS
jgi:hypothetical protein